LIDNYPTDYIVRKFQEVLMNQEELARVFERIADLLEIKGELIFKVRAYRNAADGLRQSLDDLEQLRKEDRLTDIPGVGEAIAKKIDELLTTGKLGFLEKLEAEVPPSLLEVLAVPGVGPRKTALFWKQAGVTDLSSLEQAAKEGKLRELPGVGEKVEQNILSHLARMKS
jgi:DNA polymerase (family 10)